MRNFFKRLDFIDLTIGSLSIVVLIFCLSNGIGLSFDFQLFLDGSEHLKENGFDHLLSIGTFRAKPPLFPIFLYLLGNSISLITFSNIVFLAISNYFSFKLINRVIGDIYLKSLTKGLFALGTPIVMIHEFLLPEPFFMIIWSLYLLQVYMTIKQPTYRHILFLIATGVFMIGLRHIGIILVFTTGLFLWYHLRKSPFYLMVILNFFLPLVIFFLWQYFLYNYMGHLSRLDHFSDADIINSSIQVGVHFTRWFLPLSGIVFIDTSLALITISFLVLLIRLGVRQQQNKVFFHFLIVLILIFLAFITLKGDLIYSDIERYLSIIYLPTLLLVVNGLQQFQKEYQMNQKLLVTLSLIWCIYPLIRLTNNVILWAGI